MKQIVAWGLALGAILVLGVAVGQRYLVPIVLARSVSSLRVMPADLGDLGPSEKRQFSITLQNTTYRTLTLLPPQTNCGCISLKDDAIVIERKSSVEIPFSFRAPAIPGAVHKKIRLIAKDCTDLSWEVPVQANVTAKIWAQPPFIDLVVSEEQSCHAILLIHHEVPIGRIVANSNLINLKTKIVSDKAVRADIRVTLDQSTADKKYRGFVQVLDPHTRDELLRVPVSWTGPQSVRCYPDTLDLPLDSDPDEGIVKKVLLFAKSKGRVVAEPQVPWIRVEKIETQQFGYLIYIRIDARAMKPLGDKAAVKFTISGEPIPA